MRYTTRSQHFDSSEADHGVDCSNKIRTHTLSTDIKNHNQNLIPEGQCGSNQILRKRHLLIPDTKICCDLFEKDRILDDYFCHKRISDTYRKLKTPIIRCDRSDDEPETPILWSHSKPWEQDYHKSIKNVCCNFHAIVDIYLQRHSDSAGKHPDQVNIRNTVDESWPRYFCYNY